MKTFPFLSQYSKKLHSIYIPFSVHPSYISQKLKQQSSSSFFFFILSATDKEKMSFKSESPKLELKLNLSPTRDRQRQSLSPHESVSSTELSPRSSCVSDDTMCYSSSSPERGTMMLVGCPRCLMYVMLYEDDPKCPKCKSTVLLDFMHEDRARALKK